MNMLKSVNPLWLGVGIAVGFWVVPKVLVAVRGKLS